MVNNNETFYIDTIDSFSEFIDDSVKIPEWMKKFVGAFYFVMNKVRIKKIFVSSEKESADSKNDEVIKVIILPIKNLNKLKKGKMQKISKQLIKKLKEYPVKNVVLSDELAKNDCIKNKLHGNNFKILDGRWLFKYITDEVLEYIFTIQKTNFEKEEISILVNENTDVNIEVIKSVATKCRVLNIITKEIDSFKFIEKYLNEQFGVVINLTTNIKKGLLKSSIVLNLDFPIEILNQCVFPKYALIINFEDDIKIYSKGFEGVNVHFYKIVMPLKYRKVSSNMKNFSDEVLYESFLYSKRRFDLIKKQIEEDKLKIKELEGANGRIKVQEYTRIKKFQMVNYRKSKKRLDKIKY